MNINLLSLTGEIILQEKKAKILKTNFKFLDMNFEKLTRNDILSVDHDLLMTQNSFLIFINFANPSQEEKE